MNLEGLQVAIGHEFRSLSLLREALTHPSYAAESRRESPDYQRLEFLGDAVLQLAITDYLYSLFPKHNEGLLTKARSFLVNRARLATIARELGLGALLLLGKGEEKSGGREKDSTLADSFEALIGAIYRDAGWRKTKMIVRKLFSEALQRVGSSPETLLGNPKGLLQEFLQKEGGEPPRYRCIGQSGEAHRKWYTVVVEWGEAPLGEGTGRSKKEAELNAASDALARIAQRSPHESPFAALRRPR
ncbi:Ribonuclease 3 [Methylacidimicrobium sp. AP8]|uniref:ribonuclease III n=1 Tax=Methylacidimicrobium sp. AP8 TaxID=2730359 RepID=UPI0018C0C21D|nr:ribonuclease III [Methylacidimicrobium sp. AP8]CAB4243499.1 Ribonuclease 3 [Methylacidimicrobium sp. AP8]